MTGSPFSVLGFAASVRDDMPPNVILFDGAAEDGRVVAATDLGTMVWAMTPKTWDALTPDQRAEFFVGDSPPRQPSRPRLARAVEYIREAWERLGIPRGWHPVIAGVCGLSLVATLIDTFAF